MSQNERYTENCATMGIETNSTLIAPLRTKVRRVRGDESTRMTIAEKFVKSLPVTSRGAA
jgi:hypothetical protein